MAGLSGIQGMIAGYVASPQGQEAIRNYLSSPEGKKMIESYLATPEGQDMGRLIFSRVLEGLDLPAGVKTQVLAAIAEKKRG
ncbi:hypothetical protein [Methanoregula sp. PtaB.Bin085]|uniref:hypothetical protein n=1 Tax=Methanoregula sp. PtaB.Bin085 TaxID=1811680 RepID=UPI0009D2ADC6|nr:hypothetical protein [Methanoregula sp. PtaB.Bin085]OPX64623.1 MAG: hypothetical protein A4E33_00801 [Methanoregula sp. PtaB.Bin085]